MKRIDTLYAWIATHADGSESVLGTPSERRDLMEAMGNTARAQVNISAPEGNVIVRVALRSFTASVVAAPIKSLVADAAGSGR